MGEVEKTAKDWSFIDLNADDECFAYQYVHKRIKDVNEGLEKFMKVAVFHSL